jgi:hypothetical protein
VDNLWTTNCIQRTEVVHWIDDYPVDNFIQWITLSTVLNNRAQMSSLWYHTTKLWTTFRISKILCSFCTHCRFEIVGLFLFYYLFHRWYYRYKVSHVRKPISGRSFATKLTSVLIKYVTNCIPCIRYNPRTNHGKREARRKCISEGWHAGGIS